MLPSRRDFLKYLVWIKGCLFLNPSIGEVLAADGPTVSVAPVTTIWRCLNGPPAKNLEKIVEMIGGIRKIVGEEDMVVIKPNLQWWNQGAPNLSALMRFVDLVMERPGGFKGEVVVAENCHRGQAPQDSTSAGWAHPFDWNSDEPGIKNANGLVDILKKRYGNRFTARHWIDVGSGSKRIHGPGDGEGYVYCDGTGGVPLISCDNGLTGERFRSTIMTYPVFRTDRGTLIDFRNGVWSKGRYTGQPMRYINFVAVNHHSTYCGMTSSIKNYMGVTDLSGGPDPLGGGRLTPQYFNFHAFPYDKWAPGPRQGMLGKAIGTFLKTVRKADLNIATAEWVGLSSRTDPPVARTRAVLACEDPVAIDYHVAKYLLYPNSGIRFHDPDFSKGPLREYLEETAKEGGGTFDETRVSVRSFDYAKGRFQGRGESAVSGDVRWGTDPKALLKYMYMRLRG